VSSKSRRREEAVDVYVDVDDFGDQALAWAIEV
jgi:hypothetical protein